jgi:hypothetical protein
MYLTESENDQIAELNKLLNECDEKFVVKINKLVAYYSNYEKFYLQDCGNELATVYSEYFDEIRSVIFEFKDSTTLKNLDYMDFYFSKCDTFKKLTNDTFDNVYFKFFPDQKP